MTFLEAKRLLQGLRDGRPMRLRLCLSGTGEPLLLYMKAAAAARGVALEVETLPFGTLRQHLLAPADDVPEVALFCPWDLADALDWRTGGPAAPKTADRLFVQTAQTLGALRQRPRTRLLYLPAPVPPVTTAPAQLAAVAHKLSAEMAGFGARMLDPADFALTPYLASGFPIASQSIFRVAEALVETALAPDAEPKKLLVTDLDNTLWRGLVAEDGLDTLAFGPEGTGYRHYLYQVALLRLKSAGVVLAAASRNDPRDVAAALSPGRMPISRDDLVAVEAGYGAKSAMVRDLVARLNLGLDAVVFVDDNPVELAEVGAALPAVTTLAFPAAEDALPAFLERLAELFRRDHVTAEDLARTELYRRMAESSPAGTTSGAGNVEDFLRGLEMRLAIRDASQGDRTRAVQLINKTNQFNLNGRRFDDAAVATVLQAGGRLLTAKLDDRSGSHGEILACLIGADGIVEALVLSCRVFQRRVEHAFLVWLLEQPGAPRALRFAATDRNEPLRQFLDDPAFAAARDGLVSIDTSAFAHAYRNDLSLFALEAP
ncbi:HAD-IIIC family phosphatase [Desertibaculum subflavum]|uniref:HAD-IIIC family phosphatase n=1 Tax=Desertibaculum subflavum TaxID=2268458 RepID=UPI000E66B87C